MALSRKERRIFSLGMVSMAGLLLAASSVNWFIGIYAPAGGHADAPFVVVQLVIGIGIGIAAWVTARRGTSAEPDVA